MNKKPGRKKDSGVLSGIKPEHERWDEIRLLYYYGSTEWRMVALQLALQDLKKNGSQLPNNYLSAPNDTSCVPYAQRPKIVRSAWVDLSFQFEQAVLNGDADWFLRQWKAIKEGGGLLQRPRFSAKVVFLLEQAEAITAARQQLADGEAVKLLDFSDFRPAGKITDKRASDIFNALDIEQMLPNGTWEVWDKKKKLIGRLKVEGDNFEDKKSVMDAIHDVARRLQFRLKKQKRPVSDASN
jgi:hypothetical protein